MQGIVSKSIENCKKNLLFQVQIRYSFEDKNPENHQKYYDIYWLS